MRHVKPQACNWHLCSGYICQALQPSRFVEPVNDNTSCLKYMQEFLRAHNAAAAEAQALAAAAAADADAEAAAAASSLWHEMQQRQQAEAAARESEVSVGPGLQGPGGILGDDLWMFDGGLFAEEGEAFL